MSGLPPLRPSNEPPHPPRPRISSSAFTPDAFRGSLEILAVPAAHPGPGRGAGPPDTLESQSHWLCQQHRPSSPEGSCNTVNSIMIPTCHSPSCSANPKADDLALNILGQRLGVYHDCSTVKYVHPRFGRADWMFWVCAAKSPSHRRPLEGMARQAGGSGGPDGEASAATTTPTLTFEIGADLRGAGVLSVPMIKAILPVPALACGYRNVRVQTQCKRCGEARGIGALAFDKQGRRIGFLWGSEKITFTRLPSQDPNDDD